MQFTTTLVTAIFAYLTSTNAAPTSTPSSTYTIKIAGLPHSASPSPIYLSYGPNFFGDLSLIPSTNKSAALTWSIQPNGTLISTTGETIALVFNEDDYSTTATGGHLLYVNATGTEGTYAEKKHHHEVLNSNGNFSAWQVCESQYGLGLAFVSPGQNATVPPSGGYPFGCYGVRFHAVQ